MISNRIVDLRFGPISNKYRLTDFVVQRGRAPEMIQAINSTHHFDDIAKMAVCFCTDVCLRRHLDGRAV